MKEHFFRSAEQFINYVGEQPRLSTVEEVQRNSNIRIGTGHQFITVWAEDSEQEVDWEVAFELVRALGKPTVCKLAGEMG